MTSDGKTFRNSVMPVPMTCDTLTVGAVDGSFWIRTLVNADWPAETKKAPPIVWKTEHWVSYRVNRKGEGTDKVS
jgi:hypothetical protein